VKFKLDENLPVDPAADVHLASHDADTVADENLTGAADPICGCRRTSGRAYPADA